MVQDFVTIARFEFPAEAETAKLILEGQGLRAFLEDAETVAMDWMLGNAIGYIKLKVPAGDVPTAVALLQQHPGTARNLVSEEAPLSTTEISDDQCLECGAEIPADVSVCPQCGWSYESEKTE